MQEKEYKAEKYWVKFVVVSIFLIIIMIFIAIVFKNNEYKNYLTIGDYFGYVGSYGGATLGAIASFIVISISLKEQKSQFEYQRKIDKKAMEEQKNQFEKQYKIDLIKYKIDKYEQIYEYVDEIQNILNELVLNIMYSKNNISQYTNQIGNIRKVYNKLIFVGIFLDEEKFTNDYNKLKSNIKNIDNKFSKMVKDNINGNYSTKKSFQDYCNNLIEELGNFCNMIENESKELIKKNIQ